MENRTHRILLVEDDRFLRKAAEAALRRSFIVLTAVDGEEALRIAQVEIPDMILLDMIMPKIQGFDVLRALKSNPKTRQIPVIILSNLGQESDSKMAREMGAADYWVKGDVALGELVGRVEATLGLSGSR